MPTYDSRTFRLFLFPGSFFIANALIAEFIGVKIFSLEKTLGFLPVNWNLFGEDKLSLTLTAGVLLWPLVFILTDIVNEYFGMKGVRMISWIAAGLIAYAFLMITLAIWLVPADFWPGAYTSKGVPDMQAAYSVVFGQGAWIIVGSLVAFLIGQLVDVIVFHKIKKITGEGKVWLRATGSTLISQLLDSYVVLFIAFYIGAGWDLTLVLAIGTVNYAYKATAAIALTPLIYFSHWLIDRYLGKERASQLKMEAHQ